MVDGTIGFTFNYSPGIAWRLKTTRSCPNANCTEKPYEFTKVCHTPANLEAYVGRIRWFWKQGSWDLYRKWRFKFVDMFQRAATRAFQPVKKARITNSKCTLSSKLLTKAFWVVFKIDPASSFKVWACSWHQYPLVSGWRDTHRHVAKSFPKRSFKRNFDESWLGE